jgi:hypothetical protein
MISRWENGEENFTLATLAKISASLEMEMHPGSRVRIGLYKHSD